MTRWPRCRRARAGSSISWSILTIGLTRTKDCTNHASVLGADRMIGIARLARRSLSAALFVICIDFAAMPVHAQLAPSQSIKIVVGVPAGGLGDLAARILAQRLSENGHPAIVENRLGGNGIIATDAVAK